MKILVLSLLRVGDLLMSAPVLRALRQANPNAVIHVMINGQASGATELFPYIDRFVEFPRDELQKGLGEPGVPFFSSYEKLSKLVEAAHSESYDVAINLTHTRLSGWLMNAIDAKEKNGLSFDVHAKGTFGRPWFRYLNSQVEDESIEAFHFNDIFSFALGLDSRARLGTLVETAKGEAEADDVVIETDALVCVQPLTSDIKKDWGLDRFAAMLRDLQTRHERAEFAILCASFEVPKLEAWVNSLKDAGLRIRLAPMSFAGAFSLLKRADLLITGDTSIKHLGAAARVPILEIALGSADAHRTGPYLDGALVVKSREACAPCVHSKPCHREAHFCARRVPSECVSLLASEILSDREFQLQTIAEEFADDVEILRVDLRNASFWSLVNVAEEFSEHAVAQAIDRLCRKIWIDGLSSAREFDRAGTEILGLRRAFQDAYPEVSEIEWRHLLEDFERQAASIEGRINGFKTGLRYLHGAFEDSRRMNEFVQSLIQQRERFRHSPLLKSFCSSLDRVIENDISPAFTRFRHLCDAVSEIEKRTAIHLKIIRGLGRQIEEAAEVGKI